jgi:hypothetical protein
LTKRRAHNPLNSKKGNECGQRPNRTADTSGSPETRTPDPLIKSQGQSGPERNIDKEDQPFRGPLVFSSTMEGVCSAQVQAQNEHSRGLKTESALALQAAFADINIAKDNLLALNSPTT